MTLTVRLDDTLEAALRRYSAERGVTKSLVVQEALAEYLVERRSAKAAAPRASANFKAFADAGLLGAGELGGTSATNAAVRERARARLQRAALSSAAEPPRGGVLLDTGVLVALYARDDPQHAACAAWLARTNAPLLSVEAVLAEAAFLLPARTRPALATLAAQGTIRLHHPDVEGLSRIAALLAKYADRDPDWADIALVWLAEATGIARIATLDRGDFGVYRIHGRKRFEIELLG